MRFREKSPGFGGRLSFGILSFRCMFVFDKQGKNTSVLVRLDNR